MDNYPSWLTKEMVSGIRGFNLDAYLVALEGWRRGLRLKWYYEASEVTNLQLIGFNPTGKTFSLSSTNDTHFFYRSRGDKVANKSVAIAGSKNKTKQFLSKLDIPTPEGIEFAKSDQDENIFKSILPIGYPLVIKPAYGSLGKGVVTNIRKPEELREGLEAARSNTEYQEFVMERYFPGDDMRVYVVGNQVVSALRRVPANVTGDNSSTINELIDMKNEIRKENPSLATKLIIVDNVVEKYLLKQNLTLNSVPKLNQVIYLKGTSNVSSGGDSIDLTDEVTPKIKELAINAIKAIPGLLQGGVDLIVKDDEAVVIEINATADIAMHIFPMYGKPRNIAAKLIDYYFPDTKGITESNSRIYYDHKSILKLLRENVINQVEVTDAPKGKIHTKRYVISGKVQNTGYRNWVRKEALKRNLSGYTRNFNNGKVVVVVGGTDKDKVDDFKDVCYKGSERSKVENVQDYIWEKRIKVGFEIKRNNK